MRASLAVALALGIGGLSCSAHGDTASISLDSATKAYLEGRWIQSDTRRRGVSCANSGGEDSKSEYTFEFRRTGGSVFFSDGIGLKARGRITGAQSNGSFIRIGVDFGPVISARETRILVHSLDDFRLEITESGITNSRRKVFQTSVYSRCGNRGSRLLRKSRHIGSPF